MIPSKRLPDPDSSAAERLGVTLVILAMCLVLALIVVLAGSAIVWAIANLWQAIL